MTENNKRDELKYEGKEKAFLDVDRMINEGLGGGECAYEIRPNKY
ncbi:hypothetical protein [Bacillus carboniphilus]